MVASWEAISRSSFASSVFTRFPPPFCVFIILLLMIFVNLFSSQTACIQKESPHPSGRGLFPFYKLPSFPLPDRPLCFMLH